MLQYWFLTAVGAVIGFHGFSPCNALANLRSFYPNQNFVAQCDATGKTLVKLN